MDDRRPTGREAAPGTGSGLHANSSALSGAPSSPQPAENPPASPQTKNLPPGSIPPMGEAAEAAKKFKGTFDTLHSLIYFVPEAEEHLTAAGLRPGRMTYFASRSAPMGAVEA